MLDLLEKYTPNLLDYSGEFIKSISETLQMRFSIRNIFLYSRSVSRNIVGGHKKRKYS